jgi:hypothetical protein
MTNELVSSKYTFACDPDECDCLIEVTSSDGFGFPSGVVEITCPCGRKPNLLSVQHATIQPTNERNTMETNTYGATVTPVVPESYNSNLLVTYKEVENGVPSYPNIKVTDLEWKLQGYRTNQDELRKLRILIQGLDEQIVEWHNPNYDKEDVLRELCEYFGISPTKEIEFTARIEIFGTVNVPFDEVDDFDIDSHISDNLSLDFRDGDSELSDWSVDYAQVN